MGLGVLRMADGLVTLVDEVNLKGASHLVRKIFGFRAEGAGGRRRFYCIKQVTQPSLSAPK